MGTLIFTVVGIGIMGLAVIGLAVIGLKK